MSCHEYKVWNKHFIHLTKTPWAFGPCCLLEVNDNTYFRGHFVPRIYKNWNNFATLIFVNKSLTVAIHCTKPALHIMHRS